MSSIIYDFKSLRREIDRPGAATAPDQQSQRVDDYVVYCSCAGQDAQKSECACYGSPEFYG